MGDFRVSIDISIAGRDGKEHKISHWLNWWSDKPAKLYQDFIKLAEEAGMEIDYSAIYNLEEYEE